MSSRVKQPVSQVRLTNVAIVKMRRMGLRFEVACYKNKVVNWRTGVETDLDEVLQIRSVFENVSKGVLAKSKDLKTAFGTDVVDDVCKIILAKGDLQVSDKEREAFQESLFRDIATIVCEKCVNPDNNRPYTLTIIERALRDAHFAVKHTRSAKQQALDAIRELKEHIPITRARMRLRITCSDASYTELKSLLTTQCDGEVESESRVEGSGGHVIVCLVEPGFYRIVDEAVEADAAGGGGASVEVLSMSAHREDEEIAGDEDAPSSSAAASGAGGAGAEEPSFVEPAPAAPAPRKPSEPGKSKLVCNSCAATFGTPAEHREHYKCDWHRYNLKRKVKGLPPVDSRTFDVTPEGEREELFAAE